jgi:hypothetical protein
MAGDIWLADLARALAAIRPGTDADAGSIARLLGLAVPLREEQELPPVRPPAPVEPVPPDEPDPDVADPGLTARPAETAGLPLLTPVGRRPVRAVGWGVQALARVNAGQLGTLPTREPLLAPRGAATILQTITARNTADGPLDVPAIVDLLARQQVVERLPRQTRPTLRFGVQVLVDLGTIAGRQQTGVRYFRDAPGRGAGAGPRRTWRPYRPPDRGTRVLVLSDFGLSGPALYPHRSEPEEWRELAYNLRRRECDVVGLLPVPADRWPSWLSALMPLVCWDRTATAGKVSSSLRGW